MKPITFVADRNTTYTMYLTADHYLTKYLADGKYVYRLCRHDDHQRFYNLTEEQYNYILDVMMDKHGGAKAREALKGGE
jgi:hypothetical protein